MCDSMVALPAVTGGPALFAKNSDRPFDEQQVLEFFGASTAASARACTYISVDRPTVQPLAVLGSRPEWGWGFEHGVNEAGVAIGNHRITTIHDPRPYPDALTGMDLVRLTLERAVSAASGVAVLTDLLERYGQGGSGVDPARHGRRPYWSSFLLTDASDAWVIDTTAKVWRAEQIVGSRSVSNRPAISSFDDEYRHPDAPIENLVDPRLKVTREALRKPVIAQQAVTRHHLAAALRSHEGTDGWSVCMHTIGSGPHRQETTASMIVKLFPARTPRVWATDGSPCREAHREIAFGPRTQWV